MRLVCRWIRCSSWLVLLNPGDVQLAVILAMLYRERPQKTPLSDELRGLTTAQCMERADRVMNDLVSSREDAAEVYLCRYFIGNNMIRARTRRRRLPIPLR